MTPIIRPFLFLSLGTVRPKVRDFIRSHIPITSLYISISVTMGYYFGELIEKYFLAYRIPFFITLVLVWAFLIKRLAKQFNNFDFEQMKEITPRSEINKVG
jgi:membrane protein DedA with SNARE-associated domain